MLFRSLIMQRLSEEDLTSHILDIHKEDPSRIRHIRIPATDDYDISPSFLKKKYKNGLLDPIRLDRNTLKENEKTLGPLDFAGQFGQSPKRSGGNLFLEGRTKLIDRIDSEIVTKVRFWDKAGTEGGTGARTAGTLIGMTKDKQFIVLDCIADRWSTDFREKMIRDIAEIDDDGDCVYKVVVEQEPGSGGKESAEHSLMNLMGFIAYADKVTGNKEIRATPWSIAWNRGDVLILRRPWTEEFIKEHLFFPRGKLKDIVDSAAGAYAWLTKQTKRGGLW